MRNACLVVVDVQNDFMPGGALAVAKGDEVVPVINRLAQRFENMVLTQDWHPRDHASFASTHRGKKPFEMIDLVGLDTRLSILKFLHQTLGEKYRPCPLLVEYVQAGRLGKKVGRGVYEYSTKEGTT